MSTCASSLPTSQGVFRAPHTDRTITMSSCHHYMYVPEGKSFRWLEAVGTCVDQAVAVRVLEGTFDISNMGAQILLFMDEIYWV